MEKYWTKKSDYKELYYADDTTITKKIDDDIINLSLHDYINSFLENDNIDKFNFSIDKKNDRVLSEFWKLLKEQINVNNITDQHDSQAEQAEKLEQKAKELKEGD